MYRVLIAGLTISVMGAAVAATDPAELSRIARERAATMSVPEVPKDAQQAARAEAAAAVGIERGKQAFERMVQQQRERSEVATDLSDVGIDKKDDEVPKPQLPGRLVVAISSSMPEETIRAYARQLEGIPEGVFVLRGFIGGARAVTPTVEWIEKALRKKPTCRDCGHYRVEIVVDPLAYQMLGVKRVPAMTFLPGVQDLRHCDADVLRAASIAYGAVSVHGAINAIAKDVAIPSGLLKKLGERS